MRRSPRCLTLRDANGVAYGVALGADACTEHERGITPLRIACRAPGASGAPLPGLPGTLIHPSAPVVYGGVGRGWGFGVGRTTTPWPHHPRLKGEQRVGAWGPGRFFLAAQGADLPLVRELYAATCRGDGAVWLGAQGLVIADATRVPEAVARVLLACDEEARIVAAQHAASGIEGRLRAAGRGWYALWPQRLSAPPHTLMWWLNPHDQVRHRAGWYTQAELDAWARGEGPVFAK